MQMASMRALMGAGLRQFSISLKQPADIRVRRASSRWLVEVCVRNPNSNAPKQRAPLAEIEFSFALKGIWARFWGAPA